MYAHKLSVLERHCEAVGRDPDTIRRSMLVHVVTGPNEKAMERSRFGAMQLLGTPQWATRDMVQETETGGMLVGDAEQVVDRLGPLGELGLQEVQLQHYDFDSDEVPEYIAAELVPRLAGL
jgi:alkanesulfonate monooxygenase SsuD/methylene tetrahydromethanopterin reductase-like flavin-dependent oxidoreductase (luciferase family)